MAADSDTGMPSETRRTGGAHYVSHLFRALAERAVGFGDRLSLRSKFLLSLVVVIVAMTTCTLFAVRELIQVRAERQMEQDTRTSVLTFQEISQQQRMALSRKADLLATLAVLRDGDSTTIQDVRQDPWQSEDCDLLALADNGGKITALETRDSKPPSVPAKESLANLVRIAENLDSQKGKKESQYWWSADRHLYQLVVHPFYQDPLANRIVSGKVIVGREMDGARAKELSRVLSSDVAFRQGNLTLVSSLSPFEEQEVSLRLKPDADAAQLQLGNKRFYTANVDLGPYSNLSLILLKSDDAAIASIVRLNRLLIGLGVMAVLLGGLLVYLISSTFTQPLGTLVEGVRALEQGDFNYPLAPHGGDELARVTRAFESMRGTLQRNEAQRTQLEDELRQSQKMDALGRLAGGVAHDFNNLLTVIKGNSDLALDRVGPSDPVRGNCEQIGKVADRAASLTRQLLAFSRRQLLQPKVLDLNDLIVEASRLLKRLLREDIEYNMRLGESLGHVLADPGQIEQVLLNLTVNASDAMPEGGVLTIETQNIVVDSYYSASRPSIKPGEYVLLAVSDSGIGMNEETRARIFEPFFTTKEPGRGTGLGLATVYGIVNQSSGFIHVDSALNDGTRFEIYLPRTNEKIQGFPVEKRQTSQLRSGETILLAEDEESVRALTCEFLQSAGYNVLTAADGVEALEIAERLRGTIQLLITDVVMPRMRGPELARRVQEKLPHLKVVFMSGYTEELHGTSATLESGSFLQKPFSREELLKKLVEALRPEKSFRTPQAKTMPTTV
jgi:signal transduction histidine kinase/ActR/RegA family two-component response regulator